MSSSIRRCAHPPTFSNEILRFLRNSPAPWSRQFAFAQCLLTSVLSETCLRCALALLAALRSSRRSRHLPSSHHSLKRLPKNNDLLQVADLQANKILATYLVL